MRVRLHKFISAWALLLMSTAALAAGQVIFVSGEAQLQRQGQVFPIQTNQRIQAQDRLITKQNGFIYIRLDDQGLFILRPNTQASITQYQHTPGQSQQTALKFEVTQGTVRVVTGQAAQEARERFRLNTPVAAIGVRGTDFTVFTNQSITRAAINRGAIVIANLSEQCRADTLGPCSGSQALTLSAQDVARVAEVRRDLSVPRLINNESLHPEKSAPRGPQEPQSNNQPDSVDKEALKLEQLLVRPAEPERQVNWGRWQRLAQIPAEVDILTVLQNQPVELVALSSYYAITRQNQTRTELPQSGIANFNLRAHEGYFVQNGVAEAATASDAQLQIDFGQRTFQTQLNLQSPQHTGAIRSQGTIDGDGRFISNPLNSSKVSGALGGTLNNEAAYLYQRRINDQLNVHGASYWSR